MLSGLLSAHPKVLIYASASTGQDDLSFAGYQKHLSSCAAPAPLTSAERELQQIRINEVGVQDRAGRSPDPRLPGQVRPCCLSLHSPSGLPPGLGRQGPRSQFTFPQVKTEISVESKHQTLQGLAFPLQPQAQRALQQLRQKTINYIQLVGAGSLPQVHTWGTLYPTCSCSHA